jgi:hypothetical protein
MMSITRSPKCASIVVALAFFYFSARPGLGAQHNAPALSTATVTASTQPNQLTIRGIDFGVVLPTVMLDDLSLLVSSYTDTMVVAVLPVSVTPGTYRLSLINNSLQGNPDVRTGTLDVTIGAVGPIGPQGLKGDTGPAGPQGSPGLIGPVGPAGPQGAAGPQGPIGPVGPVGPVGPQGPAGAAGATGQAFTNGTFDGGDAVGTPTSKASLALPAGKYIVIATALASTFSTILPTDVFCGITKPGQQFPDSSAEVSLQPDSVLSRASLAVHHVYDSASPITIQFVCTARNSLGGASASILYPRLTAIKVDQLTVQ